ncbi:MAG: Gfo/Idh/MocA family oxidoreductase [Clostridia bacterium]|nr:Gfo/Idh/MocA family oxidoreductase [Clostridia bacterium]
MRKIKWGVLGTAGILAQTGVGMQVAELCEPYAIAGRNAEKVEKTRALYGFEKAYTDYEELLNDENVEAVYIPLPNSLHCEWTKKALRHKKHVLCEKPLAPSEAEAKELFEVARENGVYLMEAYAYTHSPFIKAVKKEISDGAIGDILYMEAAFVYSEHAETNIRMNKETCGGSVYDVGVYCTTLIQTMLGEEEPVNVQAIAEYTDKGIDSCCNVLMRYADGKKATLTCGMCLEKCKDRRIDRFVIHGTKGAITSRKFEFNLMGQLSYEVADENGNIRTETVDCPQNYALEVDQRSRCIQSEEKPYVTEAFTLQNARTIEAIVKAINY